MPIWCWWIDRSKSRLQLVTNEYRTYTHSCRLKVFIQTLLVWYSFFPELNNRFCKEMIQLWPHISAGSYRKWPHNLDRIRRVEFYARYLQIPITNGARAQNGRHSWVSHREKSSVMKRKVLLQYIISVTQSCLRKRTNTYTVYVNVFSPSSLSFYLSLLSLMHFGNGFYCQVEDGSLITNPPLRLLFKKSVT